MHEILPVNVIYFSDVIASKRSLKAWNDQFSIRVKFVLFNFFLFPRVKKIKA